MGAGQQAHVEAVPRPGDPVVTFTERYRDARAHEEAIQTELERRGWHVEQFGQALLSDRTKESLHRVQLTYWRWLPDLIASKDDKVLLVDGKTERRCDTPYFSIETNAHLAHLAMSGLRLPIVYVFADMSCNYHDCVTTAREFGDPSAGGRVATVNGSGTAFILVDKSEQQHMDAVFGEPVGEAAIADPDAIDEGGELPALRVEMMMSAISDLDPQHVKLFSSLTKDAAAASVPFSLRDQQTRRRWYIYAALLSLASRHNDQLNGFVIRGYLPRCQWDGKPIGALIGSLSLDDARRFCDASQGRYAQPAGVDG